MALLWSVSTSRCEPKYVIARGPARSRRSVHARFHHRPFAGVQAIRGSLYSPAVAQARKRFFDAVIKLRKKVAMSALKPSGPTCSRQPLPHQ